MDGALVRFDDVSDGEFLRAGRNVSHATIAASATMTTTATRFTYFAVGS